MRIRTLLLFLLLVCALSAVAAAQVKLESAGPLKDAAVSPEIARALAPEGQRVVLRNGETLCDIWLATSVPRPATRSEETRYAFELAPGEFVGVISFPHGATDFRGQAIKAGTYSLRYELMPNDGNHMGVAPERDFLLLVPLANETSTATLTSGALLTASSAASGSSHPAVFMLMAPREVGKTPTPSTSSGQALSPPNSGGNKGGPTSRDKGGPAVYESPEGYVVFTGKAGNISLALVVKGQAEQ
jgi:hypothetical protein